jgi:recombination associated protein RdgC
MGLIKGTLTFSRYRLSEPLPANFPDFIHRQIKKHAFRELSAGTEEKSIGWTSLENILDTQFEYASYAMGDYLVFSLRLDRKSVPPSLLRIKVLEAERKAITSKGKRSLSQGEREEIKEQVRLDLLTKQHPVPSFFDVCWSLSHHWVIFGSLSSKVTEEFEELFKNSFNLNLYPCVPWDPESLDRVSAEKMASLREGVFLNPQKTETGSAAAPFLGREFLTWLWFKSEERGGAVEVAGTGDVEVSFARRLVLESGGGEYSESIICQGLHSGLKEGKAAIQEGKKAKEARIQLGVGSDRFEFTLKADLFQFQTLRLPSGLNFEEEEREQGGGVLERMYLTETVIKTMDQLFSLFLKRRLSPDWSSEDIPRIKKWVSKYSFK